MDPLPHDPRFLKRPDRPFERCYTTLEVFKHLLSITKDAAGQAILKKHIKILEERERYGS
jgi:hypothetical protein